jgi:hypothetical protein
MTHEDHGEEEAGLPGMESGKMAVSNDTGLLEAPKPPK